MKKFNITAKASAVDYGVYEGNTEEEALASMFDDAGSTDAPDMDAWIITPVDDPESSSAEDKDADVKIERNGSCVFAEILPGVTIYFDRHGPGFYATISHREWAAEFVVDDSEDLSYMDTATDKELVVWALTDLQASIGLYDDPEDYPPLGTIPAEWADKITALRF